MLVSEDILLPIVLLNVIGIPSSTTQQKGSLSVPLSGVLVVLRYARWSSSRILLKLCFHNFLCLLVCLVFQVRVGKYRFLKIHLSVFAKTNVMLDGNYELTRRLMVRFSPLRSCMRPCYWLLTIH